MSETIKTKGKRGQIKLTATPFDCEVTSNLITLPFCFVASGRQPEGTPDDKPVAGYLGIKPGLSATDDSLLTKLETYFASEKDMGDQTETGKAIIHSKFQGIILEFLNMAYCKPAWDIASTGYAAKTEIPEINREDVRDKFSIELGKLINQTKERVKSSAQLNKELSDHMAETLKPLQRNLKALLDTLKLDFKSFISKPDKSKPESDLLDSLKVAMKAQDTIKENIKLAKEREAEIERNANDTEKEMDAFLADLESLDDEDDSKE